LPERRRRGLQRLNDLLAQTPLAGRYWMIMGLLLGCIRDGGPILWDRDADFGFLAGDRAAFDAAMAHLRMHGFSLRRAQVNNDGRITKWALKFEGMKFEFFQFDEIASSESGEGPRLRWHYHLRQPPLELVNEVPAHGLADFELYERRWLIPDQAEAILTLIYGDWRKPDPNYKYWRDCKATVERRPWSGERRAAA
jgi:hypothetical protein